MDSNVKLRPDIEKKPIDELGSLEDQFEDLLHTASHAEAQRQRFALCVDATGSMSGTWRTAKEALKQAVNEIKTRALVPIQIKVVGYRDHMNEDPEHVLSKSEWSDDTDYLHHFIESTRCFGGGDYPESIGHALACLLTDQQQVKQVILIGDAPSKYGSFGYAEAQTMGSQGCPIFALYTNKEESLVACFEKLARLSGGRAFHLTSDADMSEIFKILLAQNKALQISYQPTTIEGRRLADTLK
jgi:hypothetical protein